MCDEVQFMASGARAGICSHVTLTRGLGSTLALRVRVARGTLKVNAKTISAGGSTLTPAEIAAYTSNDFYVTSIFEVSRGTGA